MGCPLNVPVKKGFSGLGEALGEPGKPAKPWNGKGGEGEPKKGWKPCVCGVGAGASWAVTREEPGRRNRKVITAIPGHVLRRYIFIYYLFISSLVYSFLDEIIFLFVY